MKEATAGTMDRIQFSKLGFERPAFFINGHWSASNGNQTRPVINPATEAEIARIPVATEEDLKQALRFAGEARGRYREVKAWARAKILRKTADLMRDRVEVLAHTMTLETGKPLEEARGEIHAAADQFEWMGEEAKRIYGQTIEARDQQSRIQVMYEPVGVVAALSAWNFPALLPSRKIAAALAAGCPVIVKPAEEAPLTCMGLVQCLSEAGLPPGVLGLVVGEPNMISNTLIHHPSVRKISLTGSVPVGKRIMREAADQLKKLSLELGGHGPVIVCEDADPIAAAKTCATSKFRNNGQVCISPSRFFVHESLMAPFTEAFVNYAKDLKVGDPLGLNCQVGPLANQRRREAIESLVADAVAKGAKVECGGGRPEGMNVGFYYLPTVLTRLAPDSRILHDEPFGPVAPILSFVSEDEVVSQANGLPFGLAGYVFSRDFVRAERLAARLEVGMVGINNCLLASAETPFGGVKESGFGREGGSQGIFEYLECKYVKWMI